ncbi:hypothetical protein AMATHDRAFT_62603, partial [Amanita thiersii Skay4041]
MKLLIAWLGRSILMQKILSRALLPSMWLIKLIPGTVPVMIGKSPGTQGTVIWPSRSATGGLNLLWVPPNVITLSLLESPT